MDDKIAKASLITARYNDRTLANESEILPTTVLLNDDHNTMLIFPYL